MKSSKKFNVHQRIHGRQVLQYYLNLASACEGVGEFCRACNGHLYIFQECAPHKLNETLRATQQNPQVSCEEQQCSSDSRRLLYSVFKDWCASTLWGLLLMPCNQLFTKNPIKISCKLAETTKITQSQCLQGLQSIGNSPLFVKIHRAV